MQNTNGTSNLDYCYDPNGNINASNPRSLIFTYDKYFNLPASTTLLTNITKYLYGADNERVAKISDVGAAVDFKTIYIHGLSDYPLMENNYYPDGSYGTFLYIYGPTGLIAVNDNNNEWNFILKDHLGSTRMVINSNEKITKYDYTPFGGHMNSTSIGLDVQHQFTGQERDEEIDLLNFRARFYDSRIGIFYAADPAGQGFACDTYCGNNPISIVDPSGKSFVGVLSVIFDVIKIASSAYSVYQGYINGGEQGALCAGATLAFNQITGGAFNINLGETPWGIIGSGTLNQALQGGFTSGIFGGNVLEGLGYGALSGLVSSGATVGAIMIDSPYDLSNPVNTNDNELNRFVKSYDELENLSEKGGNPETKIATKSNIPTGYNLSDGILVDNSGLENYGVTTAEGNGYRLDGTNLRIYRSHITAPAAFSSGWKLYSVVGHELVHSYQLWSGLASKWGFGKKNTPEARVYANYRQEAQSYYWQYHKLKSFGSMVAPDFLQEIESSLIHFYKLYKGME